MSDKKSSQAIERFYLSDDPTLILESQEEAASFNAELNELVRQKLEQAKKHIDTAEDPFSYDYILERLESSIFAAESNGNTDETLRLQDLLYKMETEELTPTQIVREAWLKSG